MLCFFAFLFLNVLSSPLVPLAEIPTLSKLNVDDIMYQPGFVQNLIQNKTLLSEFAEADPGIVHNVLDILYSLLEQSENSSDGLTTDVDDALAIKNTKAATLAEANRAKEKADLAKETADLAKDTADGTKKTAQSAYDAAEAVHTAMLKELGEKQPGIDAESATIKSAIELIEQLIDDSQYTFIAGCKRGIACSEGRFCMGSNTQEKFSFGQCFARAVSVEARGFSYRSTGGTYCRMCTDYQISNLNSHPDWGSYKRTDSNQ